MKINREQIEQLLEQVKGKKILVIGDVGIDRYTIGTVDRISPEAPVPILLVTEEKHKLGLAANVADNVVALGGEPLLVGVVGKDRGAADFKGLLKRERVSAQHLIEDSSRRTVLKERVVSDRQQLLRVDYETQGGISPRTEAALLKKIKELIPDCDGVILEDYAKGMFTPKLCRTLFDFAKKHRKFVAVDPNVKSPLELYAGATLLTPNTKEAEKLTGITIKDAASLKAAGLMLLRKTGAKHAIITRGKDGMAIFSRGVKQVRVIPTYAREVFDVSGAGDTVIATLALVLAAKGTVEQAAQLGNIAAGVEVGKRGTATVTPAEIIDYLK